MIEDDHRTMTHMLGVQAAELAVTFCRAGLFPAVGADADGNFVLGPFSDARGDSVLGAGGVHWHEENPGYYWSLYIELGGKEYSGVWPESVFPDDLRTAIAAHNEGATK